MYPYNSKIMIKFTRTQVQLWITLNPENDLQKICFPFGFNMDQAAMLQRWKVTVSGISWSIHLPLRPWVEVISPCPTRNLSGASNPISGPFVSVTRISWEICFDHPDTVVSSEVAFRGRRARTWNGRIRASAITARPIDWRWVKRSHAFSL